MQISNVSLALFLTAGLLACNGSDDKDEKITQLPESPATAPSLPEAPAATASFSREVAYPNSNYKFKVTTEGEADIHHFKVIPQGLTASNEPVSGEVKGVITDVIVDDIDGDNSPEIGVVDVSEPDKQARIQVFTTFNGKSLGMTYMPELESGNATLQGYKGYDEYTFMENTLVRRFPIFNGDTKTGKTRQLQYKLKPGEAMKKLVLDRSTEY
jgi:hypothetical protein